MAKPDGKSWRAYLSGVVSPRARWRRYREYLHSGVWLARRARAIKRDGYRCQLTGKPGTASDPLQVHHLCYARVGRESLGDLITVCRSAHKALHRKAKR